MQSLSAKRSAAPDYDVGRPDRGVPGAGGIQEYRMPGADPPDHQDNVSEADPEQVARLIVLRRLEAAPRTRAELSRTLTQRGVPDDVAERVLDRFAAVGLIDDKLFARMWVESRQSGRLLSRRALRQELVRRGVAAEDIDHALTAVSDDQERSAAAELARRKARSTRGLPPQTRMRRLAGALARRGYSPGVAHAVVRDVLAEEDLDPAGGEVVDDVTDE